MDELKGLAGAAPAAGSRFKLRSGEKVGDPPALQFARAVAPTET